jgi:hypothetical protein
LWAIGIVVSDVSFREYRALADAPVPITIGKFSHHQSDLVVVAAANTETREVSSDLIPTYHCLRNRRSTLD